MADQTTIQEKQEYLRDNILDKGYDANLFANYLITKKGEEGADIGSWSMEDLRAVVQEFIIKQSSFFSGDINIAPPVTTPNSNIEEQKQSQEIKNETTVNTKNETKEEAQNLNQNNNKINPVIYGVISPETLPCQKVENTPLASVENLYISVSSPEKKEGGFFSKSYMTYLITTTPLNLKVRRRYTDFVWLHQIIFDLYPYIIVPPVPKKNKIGGDRFSDVFINKRMRNLEKFLNHLIAIPLMKHCTLLYEFLSIESEAEFQQKKTSYQKLKPPMNLKNEFFSIDGRMNLTVREEKEIYFQNIKDNCFFNQDLLNKLNISLKQLKTQMDLFIQKVEEVTLNWEELYKNSTKYFDNLNITNTYCQMNKLFSNWSDSLKKQNTLIFVDVREYFKYVRNTFREAKFIAHTADNFRSNYYKAERNLINKKEDLYRRGDILKWELDPNEKTDANALLQDKSSALFKIAAKDTNNCIQKRIYYGYYLNRVIEEFERTRILNGNFHREIHMNYCRKLSEIIFEFHKNIVENLTAFASGVNLIKKNETDENKSDNKI